ncbi:sugar ABC transporter substrate-binding protein [Aquisphaera giovannonii]|nr:substrate-binding domain-containing protein [Aquisphaera giovannonii]
MSGLLGVRASARAALGKVGPGVLPRLVLVGLATLAGGCDSDSFVPPRPPELGGADVPTAPGVSEAARPLIVVEARPISEPESEAIRGIARSQAGLEGVRVEVVAAGASAASAAALVDEASGRKPLAILLDVAEPPAADLARAIASARGKGTPVILIGLPAGAREKAAGDATPPAGAAPLVLVAPEPFETVSAQLVEATLKAARNAGYKPEAGAILLVDPTIDALSAARAQAFRDALGKAGVSRVEEVRFARELADAQPKLDAALKAHPEIQLVLAPDDRGTAAALAALKDQKDRGLYVLAGYAASDSVASMARAGDAAGIAVYSEERLLRKAIGVAVATARGQAPARAELIIPVHLAGPKAGEPRAFRAYTEPAKAGSSR